MQTRIILTGGTGFLGSHICRALVNLGHQVILLKRSSSRLDRITDLLPQIQLFNIDSQNLEDAFRDFGQIDAIIHCATDYGRKNVDILQLIEANLILPLRLLQFGAKYKIRTFLNSDTILDKRVNEYSLSKKQFVDWLRVYSELFNCCNLALEHFYGPGDDPTKFISHIIREFIQEAPQVALTEGRQKRDFIFIDDVVDAFLIVLGQALQKQSGFDYFEVGSGTSTEIRSVVKQIQNLIPDSKTRLSFGALPYRPNEVMESTVDIGALLSLGWKPKIDLGDGLRKTVAFEQSQLAESKGVHK